MRISKKDRARQEAKIRAAVKRLGLKVVGTTGAKVLFTLRGYNPAGSPEVFDRKLAYGSFVVDLSAVDSTKIAEVCCQECFDAGVREGGNRLREALHNLTVPEY